MTTATEERTNIDVVIGERVRALRKARGWTLDDLSDQMAISASYLAQLERGEKRWNTERLEQVALAFNISPSLLQDSEVPLEKLKEISAILKDLRHMSDEQLSLLQQMIAAMTHHQSRTPLE